MDSSTPLSLIDSHHHIWQLEKGYYSWLTPEINVLYRDFTLNDYQQVVAGYCDPATRFNSVLVQASATDAETDSLLAQAAKNPLIAGVVGWVDFDGNSQQVNQRLSALSANNTFKGVRPMLQDIEDVNWVLKPNFAAIFEQLIQLNLSFDALCRVEHLPNILTLATQYPDLPIVIDHCAKPQISEGEFEMWTRAISAFKDVSNVYVKVSGLTLEASLEQQDYENFVPYFNVVHQTFGAKRMMWGSDWPVVNINSHYSAWLALSMELVEQWKESDKAHFWSGTATAFYKLGKNKI